MQQYTKANAFLSCDWGTSSFRLKIFDPANRTTLAEEITDKGCAAVFNEWRRKENGTQRETCYLLYLKETLARLSQKTGMVLKDMDIVISGMAGSSIGVHELPYAPLPFPVDGSVAETGWLPENGIMDNNILLISGVATDNDLMRGEEAQLIGIAKMMDDKVAAEEQTIYLFPGTHSKHITVTYKQIVDFKTFMTGELFGLLLNHGLLSGSVSAPESSGMRANEIAAFHSGVEKSFRAELLQNLFSVRVNDMKKYYSKALNGFYLSGLMIGAELKHISNNTRAHYTICGNRKLGHLYYSAFQFLGLTEQVTLLTEEQSENAAAIGQSVILQNIKL